MENNLYIGKKVVRLSFPAAKIQEKLDAIITCAKLMDYKIQSYIVQSRKIISNNINYTIPLSVNLSIWNKDKDFTIEIFLSDEIKKNAIKIEVRTDGNQSDVDVRKCETEQDFMKALEEASTFI